MMSAQNREKLTPFPLVCKMSALAQPSSPLSMRTHINFEKSEFFYTKNCGRPHLTNLLVLKMFSLGSVDTLPPDIGRLLLTASYVVKAVKH